MPIVKRALVLAGATAAASWFFATGDMLTLIGAGVAAMVAVHLVVPSSQSDLSSYGGTLAGPLAIGGLMTYRGMGSNALYLPITVFALEFFSQYLFELLP